MFLFMVQNGINDTISDSFGDNLFSFFIAVQRKLLSDVINRDLRITDVDFLQTKLDNCVSQSSNQRVVLVSMEQWLVFL